MTQTIAARSSGSHPSRAAIRARSAGREQVLVAAGQALAGLGNLAFIAIAARWLDRPSFGHLAAFVALLTALHLPGAGLAAAGALSPSGSLRLRNRCAAAGVLSAGALVVLSPVVSALLDLPIAFVLALAAAAPVAPLLGLRRGLAYGVRDHRGVVTSLAAEPACRLVLGLSLAQVLGAPGAAWGAAAGGWLALIALGPTSAVRAAPTEVRRHASGALTAAGLAFVVLTLLQHLDLILANRLMDETGAGAFAAISTIGGLVAFATATLPLVLMPAVDERGSLGAAVAGAVAVAVGAVVVGLVAGDLLVATVVGDAYESVTPLLPPYLAGMGALGLARVLAAHHCARGAARVVARVAVGAAGAQVLGLVAFARAPGQAVAVTTTVLLATATVLVLPGVDVAALPTAARRTSGRLGRFWRREDVPLLALLTVVAVLVRLTTQRSFWIDEAVSARQASLPFGEMLRDLQVTDVHPPLHHVILWVTARVAGTGEWAMRAPSVLCGAALVPVLYGMARELFDRRTALVAALLVVPAPFLVWYSQEARMYSLFMLVGTGAVWAQVVALRRGSWGAYLAWGALSAALLWTQWFALLPLAVQQVVTLVHLVRRRRHPDILRVAGRWVTSLGVTLVLCLPLLGVMAAQLSAYGDRGAGLATPTAAGADNSSVAGGLDAYTVIANLTWALVGYHSDGVMVLIGALWPFAMLAGFLLLGRQLTDSTRLVAAVAVVPGVCLYAVAHLKRDLFELRYFVLAAPLLLLLLARATTSVARQRRSLAVAVTGLVAVSSVALVDQQLNGTNPRLYDFRGAIADIEPHLDGDDVLAYAPGYLDGVVQYYAPGARGVDLDDLDASTVDGDVFVFVSERFLREGAAGDVGRVLSELEHERGRPQRFERPNVVIWRFTP